MSIVIVTALFALILAFVLGTTLGFFRDFFAVPRDPLVDNIMTALPGGNCGACGFPGCEQYALALAAGNAGVADCTIGGPSVVEKLSAITGKSGEAAQPVVAVLACRGSYLHAPPKGTYTGLKTCRGAKLATGSTKLCAWGCLGFGDCISVCKFGAIRMDAEKGLPVIDYAKCTGCRICMTECPQGAFAAVSKDQKGAIILCSNRNPNRQGVIKTCKIACIKCGQCVKQCPKQCIDLSTHVPVVDLSKCDSCGTCVAKCPTKVFKIIEKDIFPQGAA
ncbi:MAG: RnfABCDGE type electron transport complex subunit B [Treponema sp.]|jgi:Na+-translocating ferredoxin:NAD+ oxidoreductase RNF subunit RnfB|nr:RnfABCDGE type electron transport complex subunit B [Treponema sp.]